MEIFTYIAGTQFEDRQKYVWNLKVGQLLDLEREPENAFDANAIKIIDKQGNQLGYVEKNVACEIADNIDVGARYRVTVCEEKPY